MSVVGDGFLGASTNVVGPYTLSEVFDILFIEGGVYGVGMDIMATPADAVLVEIYGQDNLLLGEASVPTNMSGVFWGVGSDEPILRIRLRASSGSAGELVDNVAFGYGPCGVPWVSAAPPGGFVVPGNSLPVTMTFDATATPVGTYTGTLCIESNDPQKLLLTVPVTMTVKLHAMYLPIALRNVIP
jgi:hypothetical protein